MNSGRLEEPDEALFRVRPARPFALILIVLGIGVYANSFGAPFVFDGQDFVVENGARGRLSPPWELAAGMPRPLVVLSFAANYRLHGPAVWGYHAVNLTCHLVGALALFGIVRRTLRTPRLRDRFGSAADGLALTIAALWLVHPLQTQAVTYLYQRFESQMGMFYLLTLYLFVRGTEASKDRWWRLACVVAAAFGAASKEVVATAPVVILSYDRIFVAESWRDLCKRRWPIHLALAIACWGLIALMLVRNVGQFEQAGVGVVRNVTPIDYAATQAGVLLHYLRLALLPIGLCLDYAWPVAGSVGAIVVSATIIGMLLLATIWFLGRRPEIGFLGIWFFAILAPTSSIVPIADLAVEHRMYLPLVAPITLVVLAAYRLVDRFAPTTPASEPWWRRTPAVLAVSAVALLAIATIRRNGDYGSAVAIWSDTVSKAPHNARAHVNLGKFLSDDGDFESALAHFATAVQLKPGYAKAYANLGLALARSGRLPDAVDPLRRATRLDPTPAEPWSNLGAALVELGETEDGIAAHRKAIERDPEYADAHYNLAVALAHRGDIDGAIDEYRRTLRIDPDRYKARHNLELLERSVDR